MNYPSSPNGKQSSFRPQTPKRVITGSSVRKQKFEPKREKPFRPIITTTGLQVRPFKFNNQYDLETDSLEELKRTKPEEWKALVNTTAAHTKFMDHIELNRSIMEQIKQQPTLKEASGMVEATGKKKDLKSRETKEALKRMLKESNHSSPVLHERAMLKAECSKKIIRKEPSILARLVGDCKTEKSTKSNWKEQLLTSDAKLEEAAKSEAKCRRAQNLKTSTLKATPNRINLTLGDKLSDSSSPNTLHMPSKKLTGSDKNASKHINNSKETTLTTSSTGTKFHSVEPKISSSDCISIVNKLTHIMPTAKPTISSGQRTSREGASKAPLLANEKSIPLNARPISIHYPPSNETNGRNVTISDSSMAFHSNNSGLDQTDSTNKLKQNSLIRSNKTKHSSATQSPPRVLPVSKHQASPITGTKINLDLNVGKKPLRLHKTNVKATSLSGNPVKSTNALNSSLMNNSTHLKNQAIWRSSPNVPIHIPGPRYDNIFIAPYINSEEDIMSQKSLSTYSNQYQ